MTLYSRAGLSAYLATPIMSLLGYLIASLGCIFILKDPSPVPVFAVFAFFNIVKGNELKCDDCNTCVTECLMDIDIPAYVNEGKRVASTACTMCMQCIAVCPNGALHASVGVDLVHREKWRYRKTGPHC